MKHDFSTKKGVKRAIAWECRSQGLVLETQIAYVIATAIWETAGKLKPISEYGGRKYFNRYDPILAKSASRRRRAVAMGNTRRGDGYRYRGRGFVQITWKNNYAKYSEILGADLVADPDIALRPNVALFILVHGFKTGAFTGKKLSKYINKTKTDYEAARRCINGRDKARKIAQLARRELAKL